MRALQIYNKETLTNVSGYEDNQCEESQLDTIEICIIHKDTVFELKMFFDLT